MKYETIKVFADNCITPYKLLVNAGEGTPTVLTDSPVKSLNLSTTYKAGILKSYSRYIGVNGLGLKSLSINDYEGGVEDE